MDIKVYPGKITGLATAPPSKSMAHRALICAALSKGSCTIEGISGSKDMDATIQCLQALGAGITRDASCAQVQGIFADGVREGEPAAHLNCLESGSTLRFLLPVAAALGRHAVFTGQGKLPERPMTPLADEMKRMGVEFLPDGRDALPIEIQGTLQAGEFVIPGSISSQYISGLLFALPLLEGDSRIRITGTLESAAYVALTLGMLRSFGIRIDEAEDGYLVPGGQEYRAQDISVEGDYSNAAFWLTAAAAGCDLGVAGLDPESVQGDRGVLEVLEKMGAVRREDSGEIFLKADALQGTGVDCSGIPDLVPILSVGASLAEGDTRFYNAGRLRIKESDRLAAMAEVLTALGAEVKEYPEELEVTGGSLQGGVTVDGHNDHRIVMSAAIAALFCREPVVITGAQAVEKSYPDFFDEFRRLGGRADVITDR